ncbi:IgA Peptidase M64 [Streptoalloteichus tenebrarius]|uniref:IgA Peptidase M64 n=1 Tax=Streptoalloteichus tenebrarius (strain ATCC 17920 / DSM 40477 / JCM 4838 / CBS 697.72 / NBRC 16177 / NCIMB 11028 / NRRL B-12390 / A12253. 1 / ISP 5477) TaxID=1933 RepID=A0ABT1HS55_STRSD|nr:M64 family metallopeptidase [Streptoalloteichus tenebrarius]MCP2258342.1 IgA Peptidase M64 [Streptoalloteichus tenebrarius]
MVGGSVRLRILAAAVSVVGALSLMAPAGHAAPPPAPSPAPLGHEVREVFSPDGTISRVRVPKRPRTMRQLGVPRVEVVPIQHTGPSAERLDLVFVGDGYTEADLPLYHRHVVERWRQLTEVEPFRTLRDHVNVWQVNVLSRQSGVDNDPTPGVARDTAMDMGFWCEGMERLLCVDEGKAEWYASAAPEVDHVVALGNSTKYGGAGGRLATSSGGNEQAGQIVPHELGHSLGGLADEYDYPDDLYTGPEPDAPNVSVHDATSLRARRLKWHRWIGTPSPDGSVVGAYEGAHYHRRGVYRPTENSLMRSLGRPFNLPGREAMTEAILRKSRGPAHAGTAAAR